jgi:rfaE bifunctional protein kinase chain/domain
MNLNRLEELLNRISNIHLAVLGDFFLDHYLDLERSWSETSLETGMEAYQVSGVRLYPGVAGVTVANLAALGAHIHVLGLYGDDGNGYDLFERFKDPRIDLSGFLKIPGLITPTYYKPMMREADGDFHELNRMDIKPRATLEPALEDRLIAAMRTVMASSDGLLVVDQSRQRNFGVVTERLTGAIAKIAAEYPEKIFLADSRHFISGFRNVILKSNLSEALRAANLEQLPRESSLACAQRCADALIQFTGKPVIITLGSEGIFLLPGPDRPSVHLPAIPVEGPIDIVGAGDAVDASVGAALCAEASLEEACFLGTLVASIVIQQIGVTGTATRDQVLTQYQKHFKNGKH